MPCPQTDSTTVEDLGVAVPIHRDSLVPSGVELLVLRAQSGEVPA